MKFIRNIIGRMLGYSGCEKCGNTWNWTTGIDIDHQGHGAFPLCCSCFKTADADYVRSVYKRFLLSNRDHDDCWGPEQEAQMRMIRRSLV